MLADVRDQFGLNIVTEAMDEAGVDAVEKYGDCIQIGARNMQNFSLLKYVGQTEKPVLLKRGMSATLDEFLARCRIHYGRGKLRRDPLRTRHPDLCDTCKQHA